ncbi:hypothetical protein N431DRAFT_438444 [Stipitochalara longipes BDJ]|nr:hypothetical protein N431DRAFT_438444 [Stipitochalara longipes BDJ]
MDTPTFEVFPKLPLELQQLIWQLAAQQEVDSTPARIRLIVPDPRGTSYPRLLPVLDTNLRYRPKVYYPEIQLRLVHRSHTLSGLFSACQASRDAIKPLHRVWEKEKGGTVYVNEKKDVMYFKGPRFWLLRVIHLSAGRASEDDQIAQLQYMAQLQGCHNLAFDMNIVTYASRHLVHNWLRTLTDMKKMVVVMNAEKKEIFDESKFVVSSSEEVTREALKGSSWSFDPDSITQAFQHDVIRWAGLNIPELEFVLISNPEGVEEWSKNLVVHSI